ncbi:MAG: tetratricopeptide repeat protein [Elusimicrobiota bacterium]|jgi:tetratricopeptide (TPR) repeat protein
MPALGLFLAASLAAAAAIAGPADPPAAARPEEAIRRYEAALVQGDAWRARAVLDAAVAWYPDDYPLVLRYAHAHYLLGEYLSARRYYEHALKLNPREDAPLAGLYLVARAQGDPKWRAHASALALSPAFLDINLPIAADLFERGEHREALKRYDSILRLKPKDPDALTGRGWCRYYLGDRKAARRDFQQALALRPGHRPALHGIDASRTVSAGAGYCFALIDYRGNPSKRSGSHHCLPLSISYKDKVSVSLSASQTTIDWAAPAKDTVQRDFNVMVGAAPRKWASLWVAANSIDSNDPSTDGSQSWTGGFVVQPSLGTSTRLMAGGALSSSRYPDHDLLQISPRVGVSRGRLNGALFASHIMDSRTQREFSSWGVAGTAGPLAGLTAGVRAWWGRRRGHIEEGGAIVYSSLSDTFMRGWQVSASYDAASLGSAFLRYGEDAILTDYRFPPIFYKSSTLAVGINARFGN